MSELSQPIHHSESPYLRDESVARVVHEEWRKANSHSESGDFGIDNAVRDAEELYDLNPDKFAEISPEEFAVAIVRFHLLKNTYRRSDNLALRVNDIYRRAKVDTDSDSVDIEWLNRVAHESGVTTDVFLEDLARETRHPKSLLEEVRHYQEMRLDHSGVSRFAKKETGVSPWATEVRHIFRAVKGSIDSTALLAKAEYSEFIVINGNPELETTKAAAEFLESEEGKRALKDLNFERDQLEEMRRFQDEDTA